jgi:hypothetical protein
MKANLWRTCCALGKYNIPINLGLRRNRFFEGRAKILKEIRTKFLCDNSQRRVEVILHGLGGAGKSEIALMYADEQKRAYSSIFWLYANNTSKLEASAHSALKLITDHYDKIGLPIGVYSDLKDAVNMSGAELLNETVKRSGVELLKNWLSEESNNSWLLIIDNYDDPASCNLDAILPTTGVGHVLITSRNPNARIESDQVPVPERLGEEESTRLLIRISGKVFNSSGSS